MQVRYSAIKSFTYELNSTRSLHRTRDHKVSSSMLTCGLYFSSVFMNVYKTCPCHLCMFRPFFNYEPNYRNWAQIFSIIVGLWALLFLLMF